MPHLTLVWLESKVEQVFMHVHLNLALTILSLLLSYSKDNNQGFYLGSRVVVWLLGTYLTCI